MFVTIDGPNGVGKSTVCQRLGRDITDLGMRVEQVRQPSDFELGRFARANEGNYVGVPLAVLVVADRYLQIERQIKPSLGAGRAVICDRYVASTLVLQRIDGVDVELLLQMNSAALIPDLTVILTASPRLLRERLSERSTRSRFEQRPDIPELELEYFEAASSQLAASGYRVLNLNATHMTPAEVCQKIVAEVAPLIRR